MCQHPITRGGQQPAGTVPPPPIPRSAPPPLPPPPPGRGSSLVGAVLDDVLAGDAYTITRGGQPVAVILPFDQYRALKAAAADE